MKDLKKRIRDGETVFGCWLNLGSSLTAEIIGLAGFDWVLIDLEHGAGTESAVLHQLQALEHTTAFPVVRIESFERQRIHRILDLGAGGIMCPRINSTEEAIRFAAGLRYQPEGVRGVAKMVRASGYSRNFDSYIRDIKENVVGIIQVETTGILKHLNEIASIDNIDVLFIGPADLTMALGIFGQFDHPLYLNALAETADAAAKAGKAAGILMYDPNDFPKYHSIGFRFIACGADMTFVVNGANAMAKKLKNLSGQAKTTDPI